MKSDNWRRCYDCGRFMSYAEIQQAHVTYRTNFSVLDMEPDENPRYSHSHHPRPPQEPRWILANAIALPQIRWEPIYGLGGVAPMAYIPTSAGSTTAPTTFTVTTDNQYWATVPYKKS